jgi:putative membrane protein
MKIKTIVVIVLFILSIIVLLQNTEVVTYSFLFWKISMSRIIWLILILLVGFVNGYIVAIQRVKK